jgi:hypothetical protein
MKLSSERRNALPASKFAGPGRSFPVNDAEHARKALQLAPRSEHAGNISKATEEKIESRARRVLGSGETKHWSKK